MDHNGKCISQYGSQLKMLKNFFHDLIVSSALPVYESIFVLSQRPDLHNSQVKIKFGTIFKFV